MDKVVLKPLETLTHFGVVQDGDSSTAYVTEDGAGKMVLTAYDQDLVDSDLEEEADAEDEEQAAQAAAQTAATVPATVATPSPRKRQRLDDRPMGRPPSNKRHWEWRNGRWEAPAGGELAKWLSPPKPK